LAVLVEHMLVARRALRERIVVLHRRFLAIVNRFRRVASPRNKKAKLGPFTQAYFWCC